MSVSAAKKLLGKRVENDRCPLVHRWDYYWENGRGKKRVKEKKSRKCGSIENERGGSQDSFAFVRSKRKKTEGEEKKERKQIFFKQRKGHHT